MTEEYLYAQKPMLEFGYEIAESPWYPPKMCTMEDGTQKLQTDLKRGDIFVRDGHRYEVQYVSEDVLECTNADGPKTCPTCRERELSESEMPF